MGIITAEEFPIKVKIDELMQIFLGTRIFRLPVINKIKYYWYRNRFAWHNINFIGAHVKIIAFHSSRNKENIKIKNNVSIEDNVVIDTTGGIEFGNNILINSDVKIFTHDHVTKKRVIDYSQIIENKLTIDDDVWIASSAIILPKVGKIGKGAIIGAGSVVTKAVPAYTIVAGNPATVIGHRKT